MGYECQDCGHVRDGDEMLQTAESSGHALCRGACNGMTFHVRSSFVGVESDDTDFEAYKCQDCDTTFGTEHGYKSHSCYGSPDIDTHIDELWDTESYDVPYRDPTVVRALYVDESLPDSAIGEILDCSPSAIKRVRHNNDIERPKLRSNEGAHPWRDEAILRELYHDRELCLKGVADELGCDRTTVRRWMIRHDIDRRDQGYNIASGDVKTV